MPVIPKINPIVSILTLLSTSYNAKLSRSFSCWLLDQACLPNGLFERLLKDGFIYMMPALLSRSRIPPAVLLRKNPLPAPFGRRLRVFPV